MLCYDGMMTIYAMVWWGDDNLCYAMMGWRKSMLCYDGMMIIYAMLCYDDNLFYAMMGWYKSMLC